jgi:hypothetical protein
MPSRPFIGAAVVPCPMDPAGLELEGLACTLYGAFQLAAIVA